VEQYRKDFQEGGSVKVGMKQAVNTQIQLDH
jgi:hypothetical protein